MGSSVFVSSSALNGYLFFFSSESFACFGMVSDDVIQ